MTNDWESSTTIGAHPSSRPSAGRTRPRNTFSARRIDDIEPPACVYALTGIFTDSKGAYEFLDHVRAVGQVRDRPLLAPLLRRGYSSFPWPAIVQKIEPIPPTCRDSGRLIVAE